MVVGAHVCYESGRKSTSTPIVVLEARHPVLRSHGRGVPVGPFREGLPQEGYEPHGRARDSPHGRIGTSSEFLLLVKLETQRPLWDVPRPCANKENEEIRYPVTYR